jgi:hypothetical protein
VKKQATLAQRLRHDLESATELTVRCAKGSITLKLPRGDGLSAAFRALKNCHRLMGAALLKRRARDVEDLQLIWARGHGVPSVKLRMLAQHKLENARAFRQRLKRKQKQSYGELLPDDANRFIFENWDQLTTIPNPYQLPGLRWWYPSAAIDLMKRAGVLKITSHEAYTGRLVQKTPTTIGFKTWRTFFSQTVLTRKREPKPDPLSFLISRDTCRDEKRKQSPHGPGHETQVSDGPRSRSGPTLGYLPLACNSQKSRSLSTLRPMFPTPRANFVRAHPLIVHLGSQNVSDGVMFHVLWG